MIRADISLDNPGFNLTDAEVHHSDPPKSSGSSTSSWDSALRVVFWMSSFLFFIFICFINVSIAIFLFRCDVFLCRGSINKNN